MKTRKVMGREAVSFQIKHLNVYLKNIKPAKTVPGSNYILLIVI